jgi:hypothetical protein
MILLILIIEVIKFYRITGRDGTEGETWAWEATTSGATVTGEPPVTKVISDRSSRFKAI